MNLSLKAPPSFGKRVLQPRLGVMGFLLHARDCHRTGRRGKGEALPHMNPPFMAKGSKSPPHSGRTEHSTAVIDHDLLGSRGLSTAMSQYVMSLPVPRLYVVFANAHAQGFHLQPV